MKKTLSIIALSLAGFVTLRADELERVEAASTLVEAIDMKQSTRAGFDAFMPILDQQAAARGLNEEETKELKAIYVEWYEQDIDHDAIHDQIVALYADTFSVEEIEALTEFYRSPLGQKALAELPKLAQLSAKIGIGEGTKKQQALLDRLTPFFEKVSKRQEEQSKANENDAEQPPSE